MKNLFTHDTKITFLTRNSMPQTEGLFDVILSPEFYWVKKVTLPVKKVSEAKKLAESVFEGSLPVGSYAYEVSKIENEFVIIAYDTEQIREQLQSYFILEAKVNAIYFAQHEFDELTECCIVDEKSSLVNLNDLLIQVPRNCTESKMTIDDLLQNKKLSRIKVKLASSEQELMDRKTFVFLATGVVFLLSAFILEYIDYKYEATKVDDAKMALVQKYDLPATSMQLKSIKNTLSKTFKQQKKLREDLYNFSKLPLVNEEYIQRMELSDKEVMIEIKLSSVQREQIIKSQITKTFKIKESSMQDNILTIKIAV